VTGSFRPASRPKSAGDLGEASRSHAGFPLRRCEITGAGGSLPATSSALGFEAAELVPVVTFTRPGRMVEVGDQDVQAPTRGLGCGRRATGCPTGRAGLVAPALRSEADSREGPPERAARRCRPFVDGRGPRVRLGHGPGRRFVHRIASRAVLLRQAPCRTAPVPCGAWISRLIRELRSCFYGFRWAGRSDQRIGGPVGAPGDGEPDGRGRKKPGDAEKASHGRRRLRAGIERRPASSATRPPRR